MRVPFFFTERKSDRVGEREYHTKFEYCIMERFNQNGQNRNSIVYVWCVCVWGGGIDKNRLNLEKKNENCQAITKI